MAVVAMFGTLIEQCMQSHRAAQRAIPSGAGALAQWMGSMSEAAQAGGGNVQRHAVSIRVHSVRRGVVKL
jgi:hypothetical protein